VTGINVFLYYAPEIFKGMAGEESTAALLQTVVVGAVNMLFTVIAIWTVDQLGRKPLMLIGFAGMAVSLLALGLAAYWQQTSIWVLTFILAYIACFALSVGPVTWVLLAEVFPTRIRGRAMAVATVCLWVANLIVSQTFPMLDKNAWLEETFHHAAPFWLYGLFSVVAFVFVARFVSETKGRSLEEIERQWLQAGGGEP
jgi:SP family xylose:H+ symportor-like MFS transporter